MTARRALALTCVALACACGPKPVQTPRGPVLIVLLPDEGGAVGRASVSNPSGTIDLQSERAATRVMFGRAPAPVSLSEADVNATFGDTLAGLPVAPQNFVLYFRFESDDLTDESRALVPQVLRSVTSYPAPEVAVVGHTDTTGDGTSNFQLGLNRANAVRTLLIGAGLDASLIEVTSHGEGDLLIPTGDDTLEPRNRRVEIAVR